MIREYKSKMDGLFTGWSPTAVYKLKNGTKWMLTSNVSTVKNLNSPRTEVWHDGKDYFMKVGNITKMEKVRRVE